MSERPKSDDALAAFLVDRDTSCPGCGYNLRGLTSDRCPECNNALRLTVGLVDPGIRALMTAAVGLGASGAAAASLLGVNLYLSLVEWGLPRGEELVLLVLVPGIVALASASGVLTLMSRRVRTRFLRLRSADRCWVAVVCWGASVAAVVIWVSLLQNRF